MSGQPSPSASKNAQPEPSVSGRNFLPARPLLWVKWMPACAVTSVNTGTGRSGGGDGECRRQRASTAAMRRSLHGSVAFSDAFVIVNLLPLVVVFRADHAAAAPVIACDDSSALNRRNSCLLALRRRLRRPGRDSRASACSASAHLRDRPRTTCSSDFDRLGVLALQEQDARRSGSAPRGRADTSRARLRSDCSAPS